MESRVPQCIGFIMDGNRRFARAQGKETLEGHREGLEVFLDSVKFVRDRGIAHAVYYAFSTENWQREEKEVSYLMNLFQGTVSRLYDTLQSDKGNAVHIRFIGRRSDFSTILQAEMNKLEEKNNEHKDAKTTIWLALSYGGRQEIIEAVNKAISAQQEVTEETFKEFLWSAELPDPDIIVRTSGEQRLSNFLPWGSVYSELYFIEKNWPALTEVDFEDILQEYAKRERRRGK